jgi:hypothetical protein
VRRRTAAPVKDFDEVVDLDGERRHTDLAGAPEQRGGRIHVEPMGV